jgi:hypothetical protein
VLAPLVRSAVERALAKAGGADAADPTLFGGHGISGQPFGGAFGNDFYLNDDPEDPA